MRATISLCAVTGAGPDEAGAFLRAWRPLVDEIVLAVDAAAPAATLAVGRALADGATVVPAGTPPEQLLGWLMARCAGDWILRMDGDELPSEALAAALPGGAADRARTHHLLPCRWVAGDGAHAVGSAPWVADVRPRLVRNVRGLWRLSGRLGSEVEVAGAHAILDAPFLRLTAVLDDAAQRRARAAREAALGATAAAALLVPEDHADLVLDALPAADARRVAAHLAIARAPARPVVSAAPPLAAEVTVAELLAGLDEQPAPAAGAQAAAVRIVGPLAPLQAGASSVVEVEVRNLGAAAWSAGDRGWPQVRVGHRWYGEDGAELAFATPRTFLTERVEPGRATRLLVALQAPQRAGRLTVAVDLVDEHVRWFDCAARAAVTVVSAAPTTPTPAPEPPRRGRRPSRSAIFATDLRRLHDALAETAFGPRYWVWGGLLLGWAREGRPLAHDLHDADFAFRVDHAPDFAEAIVALRAAGFDPHLRFRDNDGRSTEYTFLRNGAKFEFWAMEPHGDRLRYLVYNDEGPATQALAEIADQPLATFRFLRRRWRKAADHRGELTALYGAWEVPDAGWSYLTDRAIVAREPWRSVDRAWNGDFDPAEVARCTR